LGEGPFPGGAGAQLSLFRSYADKKIIHLNRKKIKVRGGYPISGRWLKR
jgi:hypothetical protein